MSKIIKSAIKNDSPDKKITHLSVKKKLEFLFQTTYLNMFLKSNETQNCI